MSKNWDALNKYLRKIPHDGNIPNNMELENNTIESIYKGELLVLEIKKNNFDKELLWNQIEKDK